MVDAEIIKEWISKADEDFETPPTGPQIFFPMKLRKPITPLHEYAPSSKRN